MLRLARLTKERKQEKTQRPPEEREADLIAFYQSERVRIKVTNITRVFLSIICGTSTIKGFLDKKDADSALVTCRKWWQSYVGVPVNGPLLIKIQNLGGGAIFVNALSYHATRSHRFEMAVERKHLVDNKIAFKQDSGKLYVDGKNGHTYVFEDGHWYEWHAKGGIAVLGDGRWWALNHGRKVGEIDVDSQYFANPKAMDTDPDPDLAKAIQLSLASNMDKLLLDRKDEDSDQIDRVYSGTAAWIESGLDGFKDSLKKLN